MKIAIVHYWLVTMRGSEKVVRSSCECIQGVPVALEPERAALPTLGQ